MKRVDLSNKKFGRLLVIELSYSEKGRTYWKCLCECGKNSVVSLSNLVNSGTNSCGCLKKENTSNNLSKIQMGNFKEKSRSWKGVGEISGQFFGRIKQNSKQRARELEFSITKEYIWELFLKQERKCALSGLELIFSSSGRSTNGTASLDRINSSVGYIE